MPATEQTTTGAAAAAGATTTTTSSSNSEEVILALQRERKNQYLSFKKFGEFKNMSSSSTKSKGKLTALGYIYVLHFCDCFSPVLVRGRRGWEVRECAVIGELFRGESAPGV